MKIFRFRISHSNTSYAYVRCWPWEKRAILRKMEARTTGLRLVTFEPGPKNYRASFILAPIYRLINKRSRS